MNKKAYWLQLVGLLLAVALLVMVFPYWVFAQDYPDVELRYFHTRTGVAVYDMDGTRVGYYRGIGIWFGSQDDSVVTGEVDIYEASTARGSRLDGGTGVITGRRNRVGLREGLNTITVTTFGTHSCYLPAGVEATATSGTATVTGSPLALSPGTNNVPTTGNGDFTIYVSLIYTTVGTFTGVIGEGSAARIQLVGTQVYAVVDDGGAYTATVDDAPVRALPATEQINVSVAGTFGVDVPYGMYGIATSGTATLVGSPVELPPGEETALSTGVTIGTVNIGLQVGTGYNISGRVQMNRAGDVVGLRGRLDGFVVLDPETWTILQCNKSFRARYVPGD